MKYFCHTSRSRSTTNFCLTRMSRSMTVLFRISVRHIILCVKMTSTSPRPSPLARLPRWISHWLGYRAGPVPKQPDYIIWIWSFIGAFGGLSILQAIFGHSHYFLQRDVPSIIASYGASAVLCYGAIEAPLAQPRALMGGHFISALTGVCITKLFGLLPTEQRLDQLRWLAGSLSSATAIVLMQMTTTTHPPAGATPCRIAFVDAGSDIYAACGSTCCAEVGTATGTC
ncbi:HPP family-domain-containing protein [Lentinula boryana]|uniref:HPP family-domain-containing protein n=1 Tax=Lentinula boryana TaxID=40481 RepID=A0ABQ8QG78_9AGAR|nr:HPP family-domain-containing protein [Lentinula boryana]